MADTDHYDPDAIDEHLKALGIFITACIFLLIAVGIVLYVFIF